MSRYIALRDDSRFAVNDRRIALLLGKTDYDNEIFSPESHPLAENETEITLITDNDKNCIVDGHSNTHHRIEHISAKYNQLKTIILNNK